MNSACAPARAKGRVLSINAVYCKCASEASTQGFNLPPRSVLTEAQFEQKPMCVGVPVSLCASDMETKRLQARASLWCSPLPPPLYFA